MTSPIFPSSTPPLEPRAMPVTPDQAREWLGHNTRNRNISQRRVSQYARDMAAGNWMLTNQAIGFDTQGRLVDGQHRLHAVIKADTTVDMLVVANLNPDAQGHIDTGRARTPGDMIAVLDGVKNPQMAAATAKAALAWDKGFRWLGNYDPTHQEIRDYVNDPANALIRRAAEVASQSRKYVSMRPSLFGTAYYICARMDYADAEIFYVDQLIEGIGLYVGDPAKTVQRRLIQDADKQGVGADFNKLAYVITAWNKFRSGEKITKLQAPPGPGWSVANFPEPR